MRLPSFSLAWYQRLTRREKVLTLLVAGVVFVIANLVALSFLLDTYTRLAREFAQDRGTVLRLRALANQQDLWKQRSAWLEATQPVLVNRDRAGTALYEQMQALARAKQVILSSLQIKPGPSAVPGALTREPADAPQVVSVEAETQGDWKNTVHFLADIQKPENFLVFELASLHSDPADANQMKGHLLISKWYAPAKK